MTEHFDLRAAGSVDDLQDLGTRCEELLVRLRAKWFEGSRERLPWTPRCMIVIHDSLPSYVRAVPGGERTLGSSWIETEKGKVVTRRIDVRGDRDDWFEGAMAHELVHVLLADRFSETPMPRWAEEGLALMADPPHKQALHDLDFRRALAGHEAFRLAELMGLPEYPEAERIATYYGQSASLVRYLAVRNGPEKFVDFVERAVVDGYDTALREIYDIEGIGALERQWRRSIDDAQFAVTR